MTAMRWTWVVAIFAAGCGGGRETKPDPPPHAGRDAGPGLAAPPAPIDAGIPLDTRGMVLVPGGEYLAGPAGADAHGASVLKRQIAQPFLIDQTEVTVAAYAACVAAGACTTPMIGDACTPEEANWGKSDRSEHPINCVSFKQALTFCNWLGKRLPAQDEWEKAARGTDGRDYPWGDEPPTCQRAVMANCTPRITAPVGTHPAGASPYGILDVVGNVAEITLGFPLAAYSRPITVAALSHEVGMGRGGSFEDRRDSPDMSRLTTWATMPPYPSRHLGFRCAATPPPSVP